jgi:hypothetical protein
MSRQKHRTSHYEPISEPRALAGPAAWVATEI